MLAGAPPGSEVWGGVGASTGMGYIGIQLFSAKMMLAGAPPGSEVWGGVGASTGMGYIGIQLFSAKMMFDNPNPLLAGWLLLLAGCCCRRYTGKPASCAGCELCGHDYCGGGPALPAFSTDAHPLQKASVLSRV